MPARKKAADFAVEGRSRTSNIQPSPVASRLPPPKRARVSKAAPSRVDLVLIGWYVQPEARTMLKAWAALNKVTLQEACDEMFDDWCRKHRMHRLGAEGSGAVRARRG